MAAVAERAKRFIFSDIYPIAVFLLAYGFVVFNQPVGAFCAMMTVLILVCLLSDDMVPMLLPLLLLFCVSLLSTWHVGELNWLFWFVPPAGAALLYRFLRGVRRIRIGPTFWGLVAVSVAVTLGGLFSITGEEYFSGASLYHVLGLGVMTVLLYFIFKSNARIKRDYIIGDKIAVAIYLMSIFLCFMVLRLLVMYPEILESDQPIGIMISAYAIWRNNAAILIVMAIPFIFYYARRHHPLHLLSVLFIYLTLVISGSRGGLLIGAAQVIICLFVFVLRRPYMRRCALVIALLLVVLVILFHEPIADFCEHNLRLTFDKDILENDARYRYIFRALEDFRAAPIFGKGLGYTGNGDIYVPFMTTWQIYWYHSLFPQIIGSLGLVGLLCYGYQFYLRVRALYRMKKSIYATAIALSYVGLLLYSQIDPGIFAPFPVAALAVFLFVLAEGEEDALAPSRTEARASAFPPDTNA